ncbi:uncharacterized protein LOC121385525 [Gigantopelta aegis]|uniref:uncharacterized protein LOC121385525 n=1 Tax=Gigantopelta aegis TaxID=1735272 RepID=UPI001B8876C8|nr:uncharacterized protein LOC121385525 [Gigantopelta aegis]
METRPARGEKNNGTLRHRNDVSYCTLLQNLNCVNPNEELFYKGNELKMCDCPSPCRSTTYTTSLSFVEFSRPFKQSLALSRSLVPDITVHSARKVQAWVLLNIINPTITEMLADLGLLLLRDYATRWRRLASTTHHFLNEIQILADFVSQHDLKTIVMAELKPEDEIVQTWQFLLHAVSRINRSVTYNTNTWFFLVDDLVFENLDSDMAVTSLNKTIKNDNGWVDAFISGTDDTVETFNRYNDIIFSFISAATAVLQNYTYGANDSTISGISSAVSVNGSTELRYLFADMNVFNIIVKEKSSTILDQYKADMTKARKMWQGTKYEDDPDFYSDNLVTVQIYFKDLGVQESKKSPAYSTEGLLCDIGGSIGLCLGGSVLTLFEVFDILAILFGSRRKPMTDSELPENRDGS